MAGVKIVLRNEQRKGGYPLAIRITKDRKSTFVYLNYRILPEHWDAAAQRVKRGHPNHVRLNNFLAKKRLELEDRALEVETEKKDISAQAIRRRVTPRGGATFFGQAAEYLNRLKADGKYNQYTADKPRITHFKDFQESKGHADIAFSDITVEHLEELLRYLRRTLRKVDKKSKESKPVSERTIINHLVAIRSVFASALKNGVIDRRHYPFGKDKVRIAFPDTTKIGLSVAEVASLERLDLDTELARHALNVWLFSFYLAGMRISDVFRLRWSDIQDGRLHYTMGKNAKNGSLRIPEKALAILEKYSPNRTGRRDYIFPELKRLDGDESAFVVQRTIAFATSRLDKVLRTVVAPAADIEKRLTMHIARHTFGSISGDRIPIQMLQKLYRHSSVLTTIGYQSSFVTKDVDDALSAVIG